MSIKVFISHSTKDKATFDRVLSIAKSEPFVEVLDHVPPGALWFKKLNDMITTADVVIVIFTEHSIQSAWVIYELAIAKDRNKRIIPLRSIGVAGIPLRIEAHQFIDYVPNGGMEFTVGTNEYRLLSDWLTSAKIEQSVVHYPCRHLRERRVTRIPFLAGLFIANLGFLAWWGVDEVWHLLVRSTGGRLALIQPRQNFVAPWPAIWASSSLFLVYAAVWLIVRLRRGTVGDKRELDEWIGGALLFVVTTALAGYLYYDVSGIDGWLVRSGWPVHTVELLSTIAWSTTISAITLLPFVFSVRYWRHIFSWRPLLWTIVITVAASVSALCVYFAYVHAVDAGHADDVIRGKIVGAGLRSGLFIGMYFAAVLSSIK